ncbi:DUF5719 family protein [Clavibacter tessellarius]|uniref:DUF5719 family protein n=1 Tax=Clavibacter tessellarius TaxID=31965 RepID=UPI00324B649B
MRTSRLQAPEVQGGASTEASVLAVAGAEGDDPTELAGAASQIATQSDLAGLAAAPCSEATAESWLVGGGTTTGRTTFVVLDNPSGVSSTVDLAISGEDGAVSAPGASGINVPAGSRRVLSLAGLAPDLSSPAIHVQSRGGQVVATLEQSTVRGLLAGGVDVVVPAAAPATTLTMTGLRVDTQAAAQPAPAEGEAPAEGTDGAAGSGPGADVGTDPDRSTAVRILVPGSDDADVSVSVAPEDGTDGTGTTFTVEADGGRVTDFPVSGLTDGRYAVTVQSLGPRRRGRAHRLRRGRGRGDRLRLAARLRNAHPGCARVRAGRPRAAAARAEPRRRGGDRHRAADRRVRAGGPHGPRGRRGLRLRRGGAHLPARGIRRAHGHGDARRAGPLGRAAGRAGAAGRGSAARPPLTAPPTGRADTWHARGIRA